MNRILVSSASAALLTLFVSLAGPASAETRDHDSSGDRDHGRGDVFDHRYNHDHYYPPRGRPVPALPPGHYQVPYRGAPYYFNGGVWYRPHGPRFVVIAPPIGIALPMLPPYYTTVWFGGLPYYYADDTYYVWRSEQRAYVVTAPPQDAATGTTAAPGSDELFVYPKNGQSDRQQDADRYECHRWAVGQTGFDPTQPLGGVDEGQVSAKRADYQRAQGACLEARGYTVR
jgi:hypothetical protein